MMLCFIVLFVRIFEGALFDEKDADDVIVSLMVFECPQK